MLVLCELFPPLFAPGQGHFVQQSDLFGREVSLALERVECLSEPPLPQPRNHGPVPYALHYLHHLLLLVLELFARIYLKLLGLVPLVGELVFECAHFVSQFKVLVEQIVQLVCSLLDLEVFRLARRIERGLSHFGKRGLSTTLIFCRLFDLVKIFALWSGLIDSLTFQLHFEHDLVIQMSFLFLNDFLDFIFGVKFYISVFC